MSLADRIERLDPRERRLLGILLAVFAGIVVLSIPIALTALARSRHGDNEAVRQVINEIQTSREAVQRRNVEREAIVERYARPAPPLAGLLENLAKESDIQIPESQDRAPVPHGKKFEERSTKIALRKVGMLNLVKFMERIEQSGHPVSVSRLNVRKRGTEPDSYDVELIVSAFDRKAEAKEGAAGGEGETKEKEPKEPGP